MTDAEPSTSLQAGARLELRIHDIAFGGEGVGRFEQFVVFVPFTAIGDRVSAEITEVKKNFARARLVEILEASSNRVTAPCPYFGSCGGCQYQHIEYAAQLRIKHKQIVDLFERVGHFPSAVIDPVRPCPAPYGYRNRIMVRSQWDKTIHQLKVGFLRYDNRLVVDIEECKIAEPALNQQLKHVRQNPPPRGGLKVVMRIPPENWELPPDSFFQNNFFLLPELVRVVRERFAESGSRFLIDAYCGVGFFGIELANLAEKFVGVEIDQPAIKAARKNMAARGISNGEFLNGATEALLPSLLSRFDPAKTTLVLDPPRTGCPPAGLELIKRVRPGQVIYISCHPATLARDLNILCADGVFKLEKVVPLDMFPQTQHVECVADLRCSNPHADSLQ